MGDDTDLLTDNPEDAEKAADKRNREMAAAVLAALMMLRTRITGILITVRDWREFANALESAIAPAFDAYDEAARSLYRPFDSLEPSIVAGQRNYRRAFIKEFGAETNRAVDTAIMWGRQNGFAEDRIAELLSYIAGTNKRQAGGLMVRWLQLNEMGTSPGIFARMMRKASEDALKLRAKTTAGTELWNAVQLGREAAADQAQRRNNEGIVIRKLWVVAMDERLCPVCAAIPGMNPKGVPVGEDFRTPVGSVLGPTIHPRCRCSVSYQIIPPGESGF